MRTFYNSMWHKPGDCGCYWCTDVGAQQTRTRTRQL